MTQKKSTYSVACGGVSRKGHKATSLHTHAMPPTSLVSLHPSVKDKYVLCNSSAERKSQVMGVVRSNVTQGFSLHTHTHTQRERESRKSIMRTRRGRAELRAFSLRHWSESTCQRQGIRGRLRVRSSRRPGRACQHPSRDLHHPARLHPGP